MTQMSECVLPWCRVVAVFLHALVDGARQDIKLLLACQFYEIDSIAAHPDSQLWIFLWVFHGVKQQLAVKNIDVDMLSACRGEVAVKQVNQILCLCFFVFT